MISIGSTTLVVVKNPMFGTFFLEFFPLLFMLFMQLFYFEANIRTQLQRHTQTLTIQTYASYN